MMQQAPVAARISLVVNRLEAWAEAENNIAQTSVASTIDREHAANRRDNYTELASILREVESEIGDLGQFVREHISVINVTSEQPALTEEDGARDYAKVSQGINGTPMSDYMSGWLEAFRNDHPTLQASLYRNLNAEMRSRHTFSEPMSGHGEVVCADGRIAGDLPKFVRDGHIPFI